MDVKFIKIPAEYLELFPIDINSMRIEMLESVEGGFYVPYKAVVWKEFKIKFDQTPTEQLAPLYEYLLSADRVNIEIKEEEI